jgi:hypothetical protein
MSTSSRQHSTKDSASNLGAEGARSAERLMPGTKQRALGVDDRVACSTCGQDTYLRRRSAHSADGEAYELQTFACRACKALTTRAVPSEGKLCAARGRNTNVRSPGQ